MLTNSPKLFYVNKGDFFKLHWLARDQWIWKRWCHAHLNSALARLPICFSKGPLKRDFLDIYLTMFSESVISEIQKLLGSSFFQNFSKLNLDFKNSAKKWEKGFCFWDNCIRIDNVRLFLLRTGYFSSAANVLTSSPKICHVNRRNFSEHDFLAIDQWIR